jgi:hypothetical protein
MDDAHRLGDNDHRAAWFTAFYSMNSPIFRTCSAFD